MKLIGRSVSVAMTCYVPSDTPKTYVGVILAVKNNLSAYKQPADVIPNTTIFRVGFPQDKDRAEYRWYDLFRYLLPEQVAPRLTFKERINKPKRKGKTAKVTPETLPDYFPTHRYPTELPRPTYLEAQQLVGRKVCTSFWESPSSDESEGVSVIGELSPPPPPDTSLTSPLPPNHKFHLRDHTRGAEASTAVTWQVILARLLPQDPPAAAPQPAPPSPAAAPAPPPPPPRRLPHHAHPEPTHSAATATDDNSSCSPPRAP